MGVWVYAMQWWWGKEMHPHKEKDVPGVGAMGMDFRDTFARN